MLLVGRYPASIEEYYPLDADATSAERRMIVNISELCVNCKQNNSCTMCWKTSNKKCPHFVQKTNADRIRSMSDEELAAKLSSRCISDIVCGGNCKAFATLDKTSQQQCVEIVLDWLQQPAEEET